MNDPAALAEWLDREARLQSGWFGKKAALNLRSAAALLHTLADPDTIVISRDELRERLWADGTLYGESDIAAILAAITGS